MKSGSSESHPPFSPFSDPKPQNHLSQPHHHFHRCKGRPPITEYKMSTNVASNHSGEDNSQNLIDPTRIPTTCKTSEEPIGPNKKGLELISEDRKSVLNVDQIQKLKHVLGERRSYIRGVGRISKRKSSIYYTQHIKQSLEKIQRLKNLEGLISEVQKQVQHITQKLQTKEHLPQHKKREEPIQTHAQMHSTRPSQIPPPPTPLQQAKPQPGHTTEEVVGNTVWEKLEEFCTSNELKRRALREIASYVEENDARIMKFFNRMDVTGRGKVNMDELIAGFKVSACPSIELIMKAGDVNEDGYLDFKEFVGIFVRLRIIGKDEKHIHIAFDFFDKNESGYIEIDELRHCFIDKFEENVEEVVEAIMEDVDIDKDGMISYDEFAAFMKYGTRKAERQCSSESGSTHSV